MDNNSAAEKEEDENGVKKQHKNCPLLRTQNWLKIAVVHAQGRGKSKMEMK